MIIIFIISVGPWSVYSLPQIRQEKRLLRHLEMAHILQNGKIVPLKEKNAISRELSNEIASGIEYLCQFKNCERIQKIFPEQYANLSVKHTTTREYESYTPSKWEIVSSITEAIGVTEAKSAQHYQNDTVKTQNDTVKTQNDTVKTQNDTVKTQNDTVKTQNDTVKTSRYLQFHTADSLLPMDLHGFDRMITLYGSGTIGISPSVESHIEEYIVIDPESEKFSYFRDKKLLLEDQLPIDTKNLLEF
jgi:hypothetical protein